MPTKTKPAPKTPVKSAPAKPAPKPGKKSK